MTVILLFEGVKELNQRENAPFFAFAIALLVLVINAVLVILYLCYLSSPIFFIMILLSKIIAEVV